MLGAVSKAVAVAGDGVVDMLSVVFDLRPNVFALRTIVLDKSSELVGYVDRVVGHIGRSSALNH
jgi:rRNA processing protein Gar1